MINLDFLTIVIPTYNRSESLRQLLAYLDNLKIRTNLLILDSSSNESRNKNKQNIALLNYSSLTIDYLTYPENISAFHKYGKGLLNVKSKYIMFCADDDIPFLSSVLKSIEFLENNPEYVATHGYYLNFFAAKPPGNVTIQSVVYELDNLKDSSHLQRISNLLDNYEALFYAVHRTEVLCKSFSLIDCLQTTLWQEIILAASTVIQGKVKRLPFFYYARSTDESCEFTNWHPHEILSRDPSILFQDYLSYRQAIFNKFPSIFNTAHPRRVFDLSHMSYMHSYFKPDIINTIIERSNELISDDSLANLIRLDQRSKADIRGHRRLAISSDDIYKSNKMGYLKNIGKSLAKKIPFIESYIRKTYYKLQPDLLKTSSDGIDIIFWRDFLIHPIVMNSTTANNDQTFIINQINNYFRSSR